MQSNLHSCYCCGEVSPYRFFAKGKKHEEGILNAFTLYTGIGIDDELSEYFCRDCVRKIQHIQKKITELRLMCFMSRRNNRQLKRGLQSASTASESTSPLPKKAKTPADSAFRQIAPKPSTAAAPKTSTSKQLSSVTEKPTANDKRILPKFLQPDLKPNEGVKVLARFGFHAKVNGEMFFS